MKTYTRDQILQRLRKKRSEGRLIIATGAGTGISAKFEEAGSTDLILVFNSGRFRMDGLGSLAGLLAFGDANEIALEMGERHILPAVHETPVICSVNGTDPTRELTTFLGRVETAGFSGVNNFPTVGLIDGNFRRALERIGLGYDKEISLIRLAHERGMFTMAYVFDERQARAMAEAGCDAVIVHFGLTTGGSIGAEESISIERAAETVSRASEEIKKCGASPFLLCHGGPIENVADLKRLTSMVHVDGFVGASSIERIPVEIAVRDATAEFSELKG
ncbi:MAG TPA: phosphoenolpyruvate hydrolase family protein [Spirochaetia bacterium]|nr:phosphoenolpyruvate hydrolase family protein [Spirochaetia bacterium]